MNLVKSKNLFSKHINICTKQIMVTVIMMTMVTKMEKIIAGVALVFLKLKVNGIQFL